MRINVISKSYRKGTQRGPYKVVSNTLAGLDLLGIQYQISSSIDLNCLNWIHDSQSAVIEAVLANLPVVVGPNVAVLPGDMPNLYTKLNPASLFLFPSEWPLAHWKAMGFEKFDCKVWPAGVNTEKFPKVNRNCPKNRNVLVYFKNRERNIFENVCHALEYNGYQVHTFVYGDYDEQTYRDTLRLCSFGVWITGSESQGFALLEALSTGLPIIVFDILMMSQNQYGTSKTTAKRFPARLDSVRVSSAPYFEDRCGIKILKFEEFLPAIRELSEKYETYDPSAFVFDNFSLTKCASTLAKLCSQLPRQEPNSRFVHYQLAAKIAYFSHCILKKDYWLLLARKLGNYALK